MVSLHERWAKVLDRSRYLNEEYRQKELDWGKKWCNTYTLELRNKVMDIIEEFGNPLKDSKYWNGDPASVIHFLVK